MLTQEEREELLLRREEKERKEIEALLSARTEWRRKACFNAFPKLITARITQDDNKNPNITNLVKGYIKAFSEAYKSGYGFTLSSTVGTGKTFAVACIANELIDKGYTVYLRTLTDITTEIQRGFNDKDADSTEEVIRKYIEADLLIIDDLGIQRHTEFADETAFQIINQRSLMKKPLLATTNLTRGQMSAPQELRDKRLFDRVLEASPIIEIQGNSRRTGNSMGAMSFLAGIQKGF